MEKKYKIGEIEFVQKPISLGKMRALMEIFKGIQVPKELNSVSLICSIGCKLHEMFAIVLQSSVKGQENLSKFLDDNMSYEQIMEVIEDFLVINPIYGTIVKLMESLVKGK